jgi:hypothetical protein
MATRAIIITIDNRIMTSTYNHYDGYPDYLGKALETHYNSDELAKKVSSEGYISYIDDETGEINVSNPNDKDIKPRTDDLGGMDVDDMAYELAKEINGSGADYAYIWNQRGENWVTIKNDGTKSTMDKLTGELPTMGFDDEQDMMEEKGNMNEDMDKVLSQAMFKLQDQPKDLVKAYKDSLANDIRLNGKESYADYSVEDFIEDYENYVGEKMSMEEVVKRTWQHRAGIIK